MTAGRHLEAQRLLALGLGEHPAAAEAEHLAACTACGAGVHADTRLWARLRQLPQPRPAPSLATAALARFRQARAPRRQPRDLLVASMAILLLELLLCFWLWRSAPGALVSIALALPRWVAGVSTLVTLTRVFAAALPALVLIATVLLAVVAVVFRRLTTASMVRMK